MASLNRTDAPANLLPEQVSNEIWADAQEQSVVMRHARRVNLPGSGVAIPVITGDPTAEFVAETANKPVSNGTLDSKVLTPHKIAVIETFSMEFRRDLPTLYTALRGRLGGAIAKTFDAAALHGVGAPTAGFDNLSTAPSVELTSGTAYAQYLAALESVVTNNGDISAFLLSPAGEIVTLGAVDADGRPLFTVSAANDGSIGSVLGRPVYKSKAAGDATATPAVLGLAGDWNTAVWGSVSGIQFSVSDEATVGGINLWQQNMFAVRAEIEVGFVVRDVSRFVKLTAAAEAGA